MGWPAGGAEAGGAGGQAGGLTGGQGRKAGQSHGMVRVRQFTAERQLAVGVWGGMQLTVLGPSYHHPHHHHRGECYAHTRGRQLISPRICASSPALVINYINLCDMLCTHTRLLVCAPLALAKELSMRVRPMYCVRV